MDETIFDIIIILGILNVICAGALFIGSFFGWFTPKPEPEFKPIEFDWKQEGF